MLLSEEHMQIAEEKAQDSLCTRRKYGVAISDGKKVVVTATNFRVGHCCDGNICLRDRLSLHHGQRIEAGAELHAEAVALLQWTGKKGHFYIAGYDRKNRPLKDMSVWPCYYCAMMIAYSGFSNVIIRNEHDLLVAMPIWEIINAYEQSYAQPIYDI